MKFITTALLALSILLIFTDAQEITRYKFTDSEVPITSVTVYTGKAEVTRKVSHTLSSGLNELLFELPSTVPSDTIRISDAMGNVTIVDLTSGMVSEEVPVDPSVESNKKTLVGLKKELKKIDLDLSILKGEKVWLKEYADVVARDVNRKDPDNFEKISEFLSFYHKKTQELSYQITEMEERQDEIQVKIKEMSDQIPQKRNRSYRLVNVLFESSSETKVNFALSYTTHQASWSSSYDVRVNSENKNVEVNYFGEITNYSGENWTDVNLVLSTAVVGSNGAPPELKTQYVQRKVTETHYGSFKTSAFYQRAMDDVNYDLEGMRGGRELDSLPMASLPMVFVDEGLTATSYTIARKYNIDSDQKPHKVVVMNSKSKCTFTHEAIPKLQTEAFLKASIVNENTGPYLSGPMNIYLDGNFVAKNEMKSVNSGENFTIFLGSDSGVKVEYKSFGDYKDKSGLFRKSNYVTSKSKLTVKNFKKYPITIAIYDQLPRSTTEEIKVILQEPNPALIIPDGAISITEANNVRWLHTILPKEGREMKLEYSIEYPLGLEIEKK